MRTINKLAYSVVVANPKHADIRGLRRREMRVENRDSRHYHILILSEG